MLLTPAFKHPLPCQNILPHTVPLTSSHIPQMSRNRDTPTKQLGLPDLHAAVAPVGVHCVQGGEQSARLRDLQQCHLLDCAWSLVRMLVVYQVLGLAEDD